MRKRPELFLVNGRSDPNERKVFRLREARPHQAPEPAWPAEGEWRELVRRLTDNPVKSE
jgi:hypothetical protein